MVLTLTPNPSVDRTLAVAALVPGKAHRVRSASVEASGKGINVAMATAVNGGIARSVYPVGSADADRYALALRSAGVAPVAVPIAGEIRSNITVTDDAGTVTKIDEEGPVLAAGEVDALKAALLGADDGQGWVVASGSLPPGVPDDFFAQIAEALPDARRRLVIDTSGSALRSVIHADFAILKPNLDELQSVLSAELSDLGGVVDAAQSLRRPGSTMLVSLGAQGAVLVSDDTVAYATAEAVEVRNTVGAGDALLAGFLASGARGQDALCSAVAFAAAAVRSPRTVGPPVQAGDRASVVLHDSLPLRRTLDEAA